jgi:hypothetical protein
MSLPIFEVLDQRGNPEQDANFVVTVVDSFRRLESFVVRLFGQDVEL